MTEEREDDRRSELPKFLPVPMGVPLHFRRFALTARETLVSPVTGRVSEVQRLTFALPALVALGFRPGLAEHVKVYVPWTRKAKSYSPTSPPERVGSFDLIVKIYPGGRYSQYLSTLLVGDTALMSGPFPHPRVPYLRRTARVLCIVSFGIGITSALPLARAELSHFERVIMLCANRFRADEALASELDALMARNGDRLTVVRAYSGEGIEGSREGRITTAMLQDVFQLDGGRDVCFHVVGSKEMIKCAWRMLAQLGYPKRRYAFLRKGVGRSDSIEGSVNTERSGLRWAGRDDASERM